MLAPNKALRRVAYLITRNNSIVQNNCINLINPIIDIVRNNCINPIDRMITFYTDVIIGMIGLIPITRYSVVSISSHTRTRTRTYPGRRIRTHID